MAKVDGPLMSVEARGKIADALVFFPWKGRHVVRRWLKPEQPNTVDQGYVRSAMYAIGKFVSKILCLAKTSALDSVLYALYTDKAPNGLNWNAYACQGFLGLCTAGGAFVTASFTALIAEYSAITAAVKSIWDAAATTVGLADFAFEYGYTDNIPAGCQLYFGALGCYINSVSAGAPYNTYPSGWASADVVALRDDMTTDA